MKIHRKSAKIGNRNSTENSVGFSEPGATFIRSSLASSHIRSHVIIGQYMRASEALPESANTVAIATRTSHESMVKGSLFSA